MASSSEFLGRGEHHIDPERFKDPEKIGTIDLPLAKESHQESDGKVLIEPEGLMPEGIAVVIGARAESPDQVDWNRPIFYGMAGIDPKRVVRIQQKHTANVREVGADSAGAGALDGKDEDTRVQAEAGGGLDAVWTKEGNLTLMLGTADCASVMAAGEGAGGKPIIGVAHAGRAGAEADVAGNLIFEMTAKGQARAESLKVYISPSICENCYPVLSDVDTDEAVARRMSPEKIVIEENGGRKEISLTQMSTAYKNLKEKYGQKFEEIYGRSLAENDLYYITRNEKGVLELHYKVDGFILLSLIGNGISQENIGFSELCSFGSGLPSYRGTKESTGIFSTITIKK